MDPFTHGLVGAACGGLVAPQSRLRSGLMAGFATALLADLDVLLGRADDPLYGLEMHRQFSHALLFVPLGAALAAALLWLVARRWLSALQLYSICLAAYASAGPLDACTSYGTQLLWPLSSERYAANLVAVVDPLITLGLALFLGFAWRGRRRLGCVLGLVWLGFWLSYGALQQARVWQAARQAQSSRGHLATHTVVKPTLGNQRLWRITYRTDREVFADGVLVGPFSKAKLIPGGSAPLLKIDRDFASLSGSQAYVDLERFARLSENFLILHPDHEHVVGDARYAMLPTSLSPLWGVRYSPVRPEDGVTFETFRDSGPQVRTRFWELLTHGRPDS